MCIRDRLECVLDPLKIDITCYSVQCTLQEWMFTAKRCLSNCPDGQSAVGFYSVFLASRWSFFFSRGVAGGPRELLWCVDSSWEATCGVASYGVTCVAVHVTTPLSSVFRPRKILICGVWGMHCYKSIFYFWLRGLHECNQCDIMQFLVRLFGDMFYNF